MTVLAIVVLLLGACSSMRSDFVKRPSKALPPATGTPSGRYIHAVVGQHPDQSGFRLLTLSNNALMSRVALADHARHSIDLQYYIFDNDATGRLVAQHLLAAADRGVRIRLLLDDINVHDEIDMLNALNAHPNIKVRLFNPFHTRDPSMLSKTTQFLLDAHRLNRRMHNKSFIVDGNVAIIGGRNIGDAYFDAGNDTNFRDLDLIAIGPVVKDASRAFDEYWNCDAAIPVTAFHGKHASHYNLAKLRVDLAHDARAFAQSDYAQATLDQLPNGPSADRPGAWFWGSATLVADQPAKIDAADARDERSLRIGPQIKSMIDQAQQDVLLISPYFVPGDSGTQYLTGLVTHGIAVKVLTNSLASTDEAAVHAGYSRYRRTLLEGGVQLYELRPATGVEQPATAKGASSGVSLHAKAIVVDHELVFIGSMNMDQRSKLLNTEMGIIVDCPQLAEAVTQFFDTAILPASAYHVVLTAPGAQMQWQASDDGKPVIYHHDPEASMKRRLEVDMLKLMPIEGML
ncbi:phospholipase [Rhodanobacter sp. B04]|uniref:phospholipase D family protein n=1 Tax=Rhodanobacter sp. B04 TaxID=1945860 RepID=UPI0009877C44|nr:phospholipase D family protein [Rhodanobacter sp. B04]OOG64739.1 phospholipase [Rhodanobacter sp. B04]